MVIRLKRNNDCKLQIENSLKKLGFKTNPRVQNSLDNKECVVTFSNMIIDILTNESYDTKIEMCIDFNIDNNNEVPYIVLEMLENITKDVENSEVPWCTSFRFTDINYNPGEGEMVSIKLYAQFYLECDWITGNE